MTEPQTDAGKALLEDYPGPGGMEYGRTGEPIVAAIEAEARSQLLAELKERVEGLPYTFVGREANPMAVWVDDVLALLEPPR